MDTQVKCTGAGETLGQPGPPSLEIGLSEAFLTRDWLVLGGLLAVCLSETDATIRRLVGRYNRRSDVRLDPDDILQETFLRAWRRLQEGNVQPEDRFHPYLVGIARNLILQGGGRSSWLPGSPAPASRERCTAMYAYPELEFEEAENLDRLRGELTDLPPRYIRTLELVAEGLSRSEISRRLGATPESVRWLLRDARRAARMKLQGEA